MTLGDKLGRYEIRKKIGSGGMGEVYLAQDISLDREVAIKVLLPEFSNNPERVNRFKLEARATSALNHPNIITIYEVSEENDKLFIVTEYIKGETLRSLIDRNALDLSSSLNIAEQIASAISTAHQSGIIHRDIKPENIIIRADGIVKILDFGLAKPTQVESEAETRELVSTKAGVVMGSVCYMSPEQARGKEVDARSDLWSIGIVLYEMLTGKTAFDGETMTDVLANIIHKEPVPITEIVEDSPLELHRIVKKTLRKDREERYQTAKDFWLDVKNLRREMEIESELELSITPNRANEIRSRSNEITKKSVSRKLTNQNAGTQILNPQTVEHNEEIKEHHLPRKRVSMAIFLVVALVFLGGLWALSSFLVKTRKPNEQFDNVKVSSLKQNSLVDGITISPDGKYLAYIQSKSNKNPKLMLRQIETGSENEIINIEDNSIGLIRFSKDTNYLFYTTKPKGGIGYILYRVPILGGEAKKIAIDVDSGVSFLPDGKSLIFHRHIITPKQDKIIELNIESGKETELFSSEQNILNPQVSHDGNKIAVIVYDDKTALGKPNAHFGLIENNQLRKIGKAWFDMTDYTWLNDDTTLISVGYYEDTKNSKIYKFDTDQQIVKAITNDANDYYGVSLTADNKTIATIQAKVLAGIWQFDLETKKSIQISPNSQEIIGREGMGIFPNQDIAYVKINGFNDADIWIMKADGTDPKPLTRNSGKNAYPNISPDGKYIFFESFRDGAYDIWRMNADGSEQVKITNTPDDLETICGISQDNKTVIFFEQNRSDSFGVVKQINVEKNEITVLKDDPKTFWTNVKLSPDSKQLLFVSSITDFSNGNIPKASVYVANYDEKQIGEPRLVSQTVNSNQYRWSADSKNLYFTELNGGNTDIWRLNLKDGKSTQITNFNLEFIYRYAVSPDNKKLDILRGSETQEIVLMKN